MLNTSWSFSISVAFSLAALIWALVLTVRVRDRRLALLTVTLFLVLLSQLTIVLAATEFLRSMAQPERLAWIKVPVMFVSVMAVLTVMFYSQLVLSHQQILTALRESEAQLAESQRIAQLGSWEWHIPTQRARWSQEMYHLFGIQPGEVQLTEDIYFRLIPEHERPKVQAAFERTLQFGDPFQVEHTIHHPSGEIRYVLAQARLHRNEQGQPERLVGITQDVTNRRRAEAAVQESQSLYHSLVEHLPMCVFRKNLQGQFVFVNSAMADFLGSTPDQIIGKTGRDFNPSELAARYDEHDRRVLESGKSVEEIVPTSQRGVTRYMRLVKTPVKNDKGKILGIQGMFWDITDRRQAQEELQRSEERFRLLAENVPVAIYLCKNDDCQSLVYINSEIENITGYPRERFLRGDLNIRELIHPDDRQAVILRISERLRASKSCHTQYRLLTETGEIRWVEEFSAMVSQSDGAGMLEGVIYNVTEQKLANQERLNTLERIGRQQNLIVQLATSPELMEADTLRAIQKICEASADALEVDRVGIWMFRNERRTLECINIYQKAQNLHSPGNIVSADQYPKYFKAIEFGRAVDAHQAQVDPRTCEFRDIYLVPFNITSMLDAAIRVRGELVGIICHEHVGEPRHWSMDETRFAAEIADQIGLVLLNHQRLQAEQEKHQAQQQLLEVQAQETERVAAELERVKGELVKSTRLATIGNLSAQIAHDLRNPLSAILNTVNFLKRALMQVDTSYSEPLELISEEVETCNQLVFGLLEISNPKPPRLEEVDLLQIIQRSLQRIQVPPGVKINLKLECPAPILLHADPVQMRQITDNLIENALDAVDGSGEVTITLQEQGEMWLLRIQDNGPGIAPGDRRKIFELFYTTKARGTGLGLGICEGIIHRHQGTIEVLEGSEYGAIFEIRLPKLLKPQPPTEISSPHAPPRLLSLSLPLPSDLTTPPQTGMSSK